MNDADVKAVHAAVSIMVNMEAHLNNLLGRSSRAAKFWADQAKTNKGMDAAQKKKMKDAAEAIPGLAKTAKTVLKDLDLMAKAASTANLANYASGKDFRDKVAVGHLASSKKFDLDGTTFVTNLKAVIGPKMPYPGKGLPDPQVTVESMTNFSHYYNEMKIAFGKLR